jgi:very-long-chain (3R)-3-hydroxyacyl-CoA dehydratase
MSFKDTTSASRPQIPAASRTASSSGLKNIYLTLYNFGSAVAWATILARTGMIAGKEGFGAKGGWFGKREGAVYAGVGEFVKVTQTVALAEVLHSLFGE